MSDDHPYHVAITATAARDLQRLPEKIAAACVEFVFGPLLNNPHRLGKPLRNDLEGLTQPAAVITASSTPSTTATTESRSSTSLVAVPATE
ncbi:Conserved protein of uncharacterised function%2C putative toxin [Mycobacterium tuberculosis]|nr:Conserved protein of uncharacterised function%2C putative toxin [Mycobacterium tuberculosis]